MLAGETPAEVLQVVEQHELKLVQIQEHLQEDIAAELAKLNAVKNESWTSKSKYIADLQACLTTLQGLFIEALLCVRARACGFQLLCAFPGREAGKRQRRKDIMDALEHFSIAGEATTLDRTLRDKLVIVSSWEQKLTLLAAENRLLEQLQAQSSLITDALDVAEPGSSERPELVAVDIKVENGTIAALRYPDQALAEQQFARLLEHSGPSTIPVEPSDQQAAA